MSTEVKVTAMTAEDWPHVLAIYQEGQATGHATFDKEVPQWDKWNKTYLATCRLVARDETAGTVLGYAVLSPTSARACYAGVAEVSIYIGAQSRGRQVGTKLLSALVLESERQGFWTLQSSIFPENIASVLLHLRQDFRLMGKRERVGKMDGVWRDTVILERRSQLVGLD